MPPVPGSPVGGFLRVAIDVKYAHVSSSPRRARSVAPDTRVRPPVPTTSARTIRGERPRRTTLMPLKRPLTSPLSLPPACASVSLIGPQRCFGDTPSYGSATDFSHGFGAVPRLVFSTFSVRPPEVEKKYVTTGSPS